MAVVKLGKPVKSNLGGDNGAMAYIINPAKTDGGRLVSSNYERDQGRTTTRWPKGMLDDNAVAERIRRTAGWPTTSSSASAPTTP